MDLREYLTLSSDPASRSIMGCQGRCSVGRGDLLFLDFVLCKYPDAKNIVEFGTGSGLTTYWLGLAMRLRGGSYVHSYDHQPPKEAFVQAWPSSVLFHQKDLLAKYYPTMRLMTRGEHTLTIFDNGNKRKEVAMYAKDCDLFLVHDWPSEFGPADVPSTHRVIYQEEAEAMCSVYRLLERVL